MSFNKFAIFFSTFLLFFFVTQNRTCCEIYGEVQSDAELLKGLADRGLFYSV
ncbi:MAG: hypothetical protein LBK06_09975 [Planctomycetaceae bacterium]|nr:hypothetical protein [Planctomycetaceae bacterium]